MKVVKSHVKNAEQIYFLENYCDREAVYIKDLLKEVSITQKEFKELGHRYLIDSICVPLKRDAETFKEETKEFLKELVTYTRVYPIDSFWDLKKPRPELFESYVKIFSDLSYLNVFTSEWKILSNELFGRVIEL